MMTDSTTAQPARPAGKIASIALWLLQILLAVAFLGAGFSKLSGAPPMVTLFENIGMGQWFRYVTGALEIVGAILLLIPRLSGVGALLLTGVMLGAVGSHFVFPIGGSLVPALVLLLLSAIVAWGRRDRTLRLLGR